MLGAMEMITSLTMTRIANGNKKDLGFIGMLTSSLTNFFDTSTDNDLEKELAELKQQNQELEDHLIRLEKLVKENK